MEVKSMRSIISKGRNILEAVQIGLELLDAKKNEVDIEILEQEKKGFLGIGNKLATVKLSKINNSVNDDEETQKLNMNDIIHNIENTLEVLPEHQETSQIIASTRPQKEHDVQTPNKKEALAWVKNGELFIEDTPTQYPRVTIEKGIEVILNGTLVKEKTILLAGTDNLDAYGIQEEKETKWSVSVDPSKLKAMLTLEPGYTITRTIRDTEPSQQIVLCADEVKQPFNNVTYEQVVHTMGELNIIYGFNHAEIMKAVEALEPGVFEIATGTSPLPGKNGWLEIKVNTHTDNGLKEDELGKVDFREQRIIHTVEAGTIIGIIQPPIPGRPGVTVTNEPLPAKQTRPLQVKLGKGIQVLENNIVAFESGRPSIELRDVFVKVAIMQKLVHSGNVNLTSGNIRFNGDITILGSVQDNMTVEAGGNILIQQSINGAKVESLHSIIANQNVIGSELSAGKNNLLIAEMGYLLATIIEQLDRMLAVIHQLIESSAFKSSDFPQTGLKPLIHILLEKKFKNFVTLAKNYLKLVKRGEEFLFDEDWEEVSDTFNRLFLTVSADFISIDMVKKLISKVKRLYEFSDTKPEPNSYITIPSATNSKLYCSGNVTVTGKGCINTRIHSEGSVVIKKVLRGGDVFAKQGAQIQETGSESGTATMIAVPNDQTIRINKAMEGTTLKIGHARKEIKQTTHSIFARLKDGEIAIEYM